MTGVVCKLYVWLVYKLQVLVCLVSVFDLALSVVRRFWVGISLKSTLIWPDVLFSWTATDDLGILVFV